jgi:5-methylcytosine-specific restriction endonuclease McrA
VTRAEWAKRPNRSSKAWISKVDRLSVYLRDGFLCGYCGRDLHNAKPSEVHLDHLTPRSKGGDDKPTNVVLSCNSCNCRRKELHWRRFATPEAAARISRQRRRVLPTTLARAILSGDTEIR